MSVTRLGSTQKFADNWEAAFGKGKKKTAQMAAVKSPKKKTAKKKAGKKSPEKKPAAQKKKSPGKKKTRVKSKELQKSLF
jgi:hypothetical protein